MAGRTRTAAALAIGLVLGGGAAALVTHWHDAAESARLARRVQQLESELRIATERVAQLERRANRACPEGPAPARRDAGQRAAARPAPASPPPPAGDEGAADEEPTPAASAEALAEWDRRWRDAWQRDADRYGAADMDRIEQLYREGGDDFDTVEGRETLADLVESYPESNRAQCAAMNLGGAYLEEGDLAPAQSWLEFVIDSGSGAVFGNGEAVLPKALLNYGMLMQEQGDANEARAAWQRIIDELAGETDAGGTPYGALAAELLGTLPR